MENKTLIGVIAIVSVAVLSISLVSALPFFELNKNLTDAEKQQIQQFRTDIQKAIENKDFNSWKSLMESQLTQANFDKIVQRHDNMSQIKTLQDQLKQAIKDKDNTKIDELKKQLADLMPPRAFMRGNKHMFGMNNTK